MNVACGMNCMNPTVLFNKCKWGCSSAEQSLTGPCLGEEVSPQNKNPSPCLCPQPRQLPVCLKNLSSHPFAPLERLLVWLLPFLD